MNIKIILLTLLAASVLGAGLILLWVYGVSGPWFETPQYRGAEVVAPVTPDSPPGEASHGTGPFGRTPMDVEFLNSGKVLPSSLPFSEAVRVGDTLYLSGQLGIVPGTMKLVPGGIKEEARQTMENIRTSLEGHGYSMRDLIKCTIMLADISEWAAFNEVYESFFAGRFPARSAFGTSGLALGARVEVECIAVRGQ